MSNICYEETNFAIYGIILQKAINRVLSKIGLSDEGITWVIFNEKPCMKNGILHSPIVLPNSYRYGYCNVDKKIIGISTAAIMKAPNYDFLTIMQKISPQQKEDFLVNVILDELAHITTGKDHGSKAYNDTLSDYHRRYYIGNTCCMIVGNENMMKIFKKSSIYPKLTF